MTVLFVVSSRHEWCIAHSTKMLVYDARVRINANVSQRVVLVADPDIIILSPILEYN